MTILYLTMQMPSCYHIDSWMNTLSVVYEGYLHPSPQTVDGTLPTSLLVSLPHLDVH